MEHHSVTDVPIDVYERYCDVRKKVYEELQGKLSKDYSNWHTLATRGIEEDRELFLDGVADKMIMYSKLYEFFNDDKVITSVYEQCKFTLIRYVKVNLGNRQGVFKLASKIALMEKTQTIRPLYSDVLPRTSVVYLDTDKSHRHSLEDRKIEIRRLMDLDFYGKFDLLDLSYKKEEVIKVNPFEPIRIERKKNTY